jgi:hypothetical protein
MEGERPISREKQVTFAAQQDFFIFYNSFGDLVTFYEDDI